MTVNNPITPGLLTSKQAAELLGISTRTLWRLQAAKEIAYIKLGKSVRFDPADLAAYIQSQKVATRRK